MKYLATLLVLISVSFVACKDSGPPPEKNVITEALATEGTLVLDVRSSGEYAGGHAEGAIHVPVGEISERIATLQPNKDAQIIVYCASGNRSGKATELLSSMGYTKILDAKTPSAVAKAMGKELVK